MSFNVVFSVMGDPCMSYTQEKLEIVDPVKSTVKQSTGLVPSQMPI